jgi:hypothetical protein
VLLSYTAGLTFDAPAGKSDLVPADSRHGWDLRWRAGAGTGPTWALQSRSGRTTWLSQGPSSLPQPCWES